MSKKGISIKCTQVFWFICLSIAHNVYSKQTFDQRAPRTWNQLWVNCQSARMLAMSEHLITTLNRCHLHSTPLNPFLNHYWPHWWLFEIGICWKWGKGCWVPQACNHEPNSSARKCRNLWPPSWSNPTWRYLKKAALQFQGLWHLDLMASSVQCSRPSIREHPPKIAKMAVSSKNDNYRKFTLGVWKNPIAHPGRQKHVLPKTGLMKGDTNRFWAPVLFDSYNFCIIPV